MAHRVVLIPGDGTGPELTEATRRVLEATGVELEWDVREAGADVMEKHGGNPLPPDVLDADPRDRRRAEGTDHDARRRRLPLGQRRAPQGARHVRAGAPVQELSRRPQPLRGRRPDHRAREHRGSVRRHRVRAGHAGGRRADRVDRGARRHGSATTTRASRSSRSRSPARAASSSSPSTTRAATAAARSRPCTRRTS